MPLVFIDAPDPAEVADTCSIRYEDDDGFTVHEGECYVHRETDPDCEWQNHRRLDAFLQRVLG
jgi:hypothetical protein